MKSSGGKGRRSCITVKRENLQLANICSNRDCDPLASEDSSPSEEKCMLGDICRVTLGLVKVLGLGKSGGNEQRTQLRWILPRENMKLCE